MNAQLAIGVFDSGVGGLTVLNALCELLPHESLVYLGDTARVPYGTRSARAVERYSINNARTLYDRAPLKMLVVACNTASAVALPALRQALPIPVVGVIEPGARAALAAQRSGDIAVLSTTGTAKSGAYGAALQSFGYAGRVIHQPCPLLVPLVEEGWTEEDVTDLVLDKYIGALPNSVDTAVLGCTHYPLLRSAIGRAFSRRDMAHVQIVDGARATALEVKRMLEERDLAVASPSMHKRDVRTLQFFVTDAPEQMAALAPRFLGAPVSSTDIELVDVMMTHPTDSGTQGSENPSA